MARSAWGRAPQSTNEIDTILIGLGLAPGAAAWPPHKALRLARLRRSDDELLIEQDEVEDEEEDARSPSPTVASRILMLAMPGLVPFLLAIFFVSIVRVDFGAFSDWYLRIFGAIAFVFSLVIFIGGLMQMTLSGGAARGLFVMGLAVANFVLTFATMIAGLALYQVLFIHPLPAAPPSRHLVDIYRVATTAFFERMNVTVPQPVVQLSLSLLGSVILSFLGALGGRILRTKVRAA